MNWSVFNRWSGGFAASCLFIWAVSFFFVDSVVPMEWNDDLGMYVEQEGVTQRFRSEGWADSHKGRYGLTAEEALIFNSPGRKFLFWGDSQAQAVRIPEAKRATGVFNAANDELKGVTVAGGGRGSADYYFSIPRYEKLTDGIEGHVILLTEMRDVMPHGEVKGHSRFLAGPWRLEEAEAAPSKLALATAPLVSSLGLDFVYDIFRRIKTYDFRLLGKTGGGSSHVAAVRSRDDLEQGWVFLLSRFKEQTDGFLVFVYVPPGPCLKDGLVFFEDDGVQLKERFRKQCESAGVGFIDLSRDFRVAYENTGQLARGFFNTPQGAGHLNEEGHAIIAEALRRYFKGDRQ